MRKLHLALLAAAVVTGTALAQAPAPAPAAAPARTVKAVQPGLLEVTGPRVNEAVGAGIVKLVATPGKGGKSIEVQSPWGNIYFDWPKDVKPVAFTIETGKSGAFEATISAPGFTEANKADYKAALDAVVPMAISKAQAQKAAKSK